MLTAPGKGFSETFIVWNDKINLIGSIVPANEGRGSIYGTIKFKNGENLSFSSKSNQFEILHQKLMSLCQFIAKFYGTNIIHKKEPVASSVNEVCIHFIKESPMMN